MGLLIHNVTIFTNDPQRPLVANGAIAIEGTRIVAVGAAAELLTQYNGFEQMNGHGRLLMPGLTNAHMHFYGLYARGLALNQTPHNFHEILQHLWWALDKVLDDEAVYYSALLPAITAVRHGVTSIIDHHASPHAVDGSLDRIEEALSQIGVRGLLCYELSDRDGRAIRDKGLAENERYIRKCIAAREADADDLFEGMMGLHASFTLDNESLEKAAATAQSLNRGCHIHLLEDAVDERLSCEKYGRGAVERLYQFGVLSEKSLVAHGIFLDEHGRELIADTNTMVVHQAQSNMNNAVGRADVFALLDKGITVGIGTDGMTPDLRREIMTGFLMHKHHTADNNLGWAEYEQMALRNNPAIYQRLTGQKIGRIGVGYLADVILVDYYPPTPLTEDNFWGHFLFGLIDAAVNTTIINGRVVMHNKEIPHVDEAQLAAESRVVAARVWENYRS